MRRLTTPDLDDICPACDGSGEGFHEGTICTKCRGQGVRVEVEDDDPPDWWLEEKAERRRENSL